MQTSSFRFSGAPARVRTLVGLVGQFAFRPFLVGGALLVGATVASAVPITLRWQDNATNETGFAVERAADGVTFAAIGSVGANITTFTDASAAAGATYSFRVRAYNASGNSAYSNLASVTMPSVPPANTPPTLSNLADRTLTAGTNSGAIAFTISDAETAAGSLTMTGTSSNSILVAASGIVFGGSGGNRSVTITPVAGRTGTTTITVSVRDGALTTSDTFVLTVTSAPTANTAPTIGAIANRSVSEDTSTGAIAFTIADAQTSASSLTVSASSSNATVVPLTNITFGGSGANRTVAVTPALNQSGSASITVTVRDGTLSAASTFVLTVSPVNDAPAISAIAGQSIERGAVLGPVSFTVGDVETAAASLVVSSTTSNPTLVPTSAITLAGSGANRSVTVRPVATESGSATITLSVSDGVRTSTTAFPLTVTFASQVLTASDIGAPAVRGSTSSVNGVHTLLAAGADIWGRKDQFHFARQTLTGDAEMTVRVASLTRTDGWAKAGLMFRASLNADAAYVAVFVTPDNGIVMQGRQATGGLSYRTAAVAGRAPVWLRLLRTGGTFYAFSSTDGVNWDLIEFGPLAMPATLQGGLAVTSRKSTTRATAVFDHFTVD